MEGGRRKPKGGPLSFSSGDCVMGKPTENHRSWFGREGIERSCENLLLAVSAEILYKLLYAVIWDSELKMGPSR